MKATLVTALLFAGIASDARSLSGAQAVSRAQQILAARLQPDGPGCAVAVERAGSPIVRSAYGLSNLEHPTAITPQTIFEAGSVAKQFTAAAVLLLVQDGRLSLNDDVRRYFPELPDYGRPITVAHLLDHTSGLRDWRAVRALAGWPLGAAVHANSDVLRVAVRQTALNHTPGDQYSYTNTGYGLAALLVHRISGQTLAEFSRERIFEPLGLLSTQWRNDFRRVVPGRATAYGRDGAEFYQDMPFENAYGAGGLLTTVDDLLRWNRALDAGLLGPGVTEALQEPSRLTNGQLTGYARGLMISRHLGVVEYGHGGVTSGYVAYSARYPSQRVSVAVLCNAGYVNPREIAQELAATALVPDAQAGEAPAPLGDSESGGAPPGPLWRPTAEELQAIAGRYRSDEVGVAYFLELAPEGLLLRLDGPPGDVRTVSPGAVDTLVFAGGFLTLERGATGEITGFRVHVQRVSGLLFHREHR